MYRPDLFGTTGKIDFGRIENPYIPHLAKIEKIEEMSEDTRLYTVKFRDRKVEKNFTYKPGQFVMFTHFGIGEVAISICSSPTKRKIQLAIRKVGMVTDKIHELEEGAVVGIRGPYGNGFPMDSIKGKDVLVVSGGMGLAPLRGAIDYMLDNRKDYGKITVFLGCKEPSAILFGKDIERWMKKIEFLITVDQACEGWKGNVGVVTTLFDKVELDGKNSCALVCGPPVMYKFVGRELIKRNFAKEEIFYSLERRMKCGLGKCGHCLIAHKFTCLDGPVFTHFDAESLEGFF
ncbi:MAG: FAD/NAD(P)-binding protein [Thermoplasmata archaeon]